MKYMDGVRDIVTTFTKTIPMVLQGLFIYGYFLVLFAVLGIEAWEDGLSQQCVVKNSEKPLVPRRFCIYSTNMTEYDSHSQCPNIDNICSNTIHLDNGYTGFHHIYVAVFTVYKLSSGSGMGPIIQGLMSTKSPLVILYAISVTLFLSFMVFALFVAIVRG